MAGFMRRVAMRVADWRMSTPRLVRAIGLVGYAGLGCGLALAIGLGWESGMLAVVAGIAGWFAGWARGLDEGMVIAGAVAGLERLDRLEGRAVAAGLDNGSKRPYSMPAKGEKKGQPERQP